MGLSHADDRRIVERQDAMWKRMTGSICSACGEAKRVRTVALVDPIAVLNATTAVKYTAVERKPVVRVARANRIRLAQRPRRSRLYAYYRRAKLALSRRWRHHQRRTRVAHAAPIL